METGSGEGWAFRVAHRDRAPGHAQRPPRSLPAQAHPTFLTALLCPTHCETPPTSPCLLLGEPPRPGSRLSVSLSPPHSRDTLGPINMAGKPAWAGPGVGGGRRTW